MKYFIIAAIIFFVAESIYYDKEESRLRDVMDEYDMLDEEYVNARKKLRFISKIHGGTIIAMILIAIIYFLF